MKLLFKTLQSERIAASLGYDICIGIAVMKTVRVVYIFKFSKPGKSLSVSQCWHQSMIVHP